MKTPGEKRGRPSKLTDDIEQRICAGLRSGNFRGVVLRWVGLGQRTFRDWMAEGQTKPEGRKGLFRRRVLEAEQSAEMRAVGLVMKAAAEDPRHAQWWLERKFPKRWARSAPQKHEVTGADGGPLEVVVRIISEGEDA